MNKIIGFFLTNPWAVLALIGLLGYGWMKWQGYEIADLRLDKAKLESTVKVEREHHTKVVAAFTDKGAKDHDRQIFEREASAAVAGAGGNDMPSIAMRDAYQRVFTRYHARTAENPR